MRAAGISDSIREFGSLLLALPISLCYIPPMDTLSLPECLTFAKLHTCFGFADADTLRRAFVRHVGVTPAEYRKRFTQVVA